MPSSAPQRLSDLSDASDSAPLSYRLHNTSPFAAHRPHSLGNGNSPVPGKCRLLSASMNLSMTRLQLESCTESTTAQKTNKKLDALMGWYTDVHINWRKVVSNFVELWEKREAGNRKEKPTAVDALAEPAKETLERNVSAWDAGAQKGRLETILQRIRDAVVGLSSLQLYELKKEPANLNRTSEFKFHEQLKFVQSPPMSSQV